MRPQQYIGLFLLLVGVVIAFGPKFFDMPNKPKQGRGTVNETNKEVQEGKSEPISKPAITLQPTESALKNLDTPPAPSSNKDYIAMLTQRALREAEAAAQRASKSFRKEMVAPLETNDRSFAEKLYTIGANARAISKNEAEYRDYVAKRFHEELTSCTDIRKNLDAVAFEFLTRLDRIGQQIAIESGLDITNLPNTTITIKDFDNILKSNIKESVSTTTQEIQSQSKTGAAIQGGTIAVTYPITVALTKNHQVALVIDLAISEAVSKVSEMYRDPIGGVAIEAHRAAEQLADRICFGTEQEEGLYEALLKIAHYHNRQLHAILRQSNATSEQESLDAVFSDKPL